MSGKPVLTMFYLISECESGNPGWLENGYQRHQGHLGCTGFYSAEDTYYVFTKYFVALLMYYLKEGSGYTPVDLETRKLINTPPVM